MKLDAHQHFWRYDAAQYPWIPPGSALHRDWLPRNLAELQKPLGFDGSIAVQARQSVAESDWLLGLADADERVKAVVGWVDLRAPNVADDLARLARHPKFAGVRHVVQDEPDDRFLIGADFVRGIAQLAPLKLTYDLLVLPRQLPAAIELVRHFPSQSFVLDHLAKPRIKDGTLEPWRTHLRELAQAPNVMCKVSGLITEADHAQWQPDDFTPFLDIAFKSFGEDRLMFGSDWPVCLLAGNYDRVCELVDHYAQRLSPTARAKLFGQNAARFYIER